MKLQILAVMATLGILMAASPAFALSLHEARDAGILGEKKDGYVAVLKESADADALAKDVNDKRLQEYTRISTEKSQPVNVVAALAAGQIVNSLGSGDHYQDASGNWKVHP